MRWEIHLFAVKGINTGWSWHVRYTYVFTMRDKYRVVIGWTDKNSQEGRIREIMSGTGGGEGEIK
jgi:hypothetical protein